MPKREVQSKGARIQRYATKRLAHRRLRDLHGLVQFFAGLFFLSSLLQHNVIGIHIRVSEQDASMLVQVPRGPLCALNDRLEERYGALHYCCLSSRDAGGRNTESGTCLPA